MSSQYKTDDVCGTLAGYSRHRYRKTEICEPCRRAWNNYQADTRRLGRRRRPEGRAS